MSGPRVRERRRRQTASRTKTESVATSESGLVEKMDSTEVVAQENNLKEEVNTTEEVRDFSRRSEQEQVPNLDLFGDFRVDGQIFGKEGVSGGGDAIKKEMLEELINQAVENSHR